MKKLLVILITLVSVTAASQNLELKNLEGVGSKLHVEHEWELREFRMQDYSGDTVLIMFYLYDKFFDCNYVYTDLFVRERIKTRDHGEIWYRCVKYNGDVAYTVWFTDYDVYGVRHLVIDYWHTMRGGGNLWTARISLPEGEYPIYAENISH